MTELKPNIRSANIEDAMELSLLYHKCYQGRYPDKLMKDVDLIKAFIQKEGNEWIVAEADKQLVGSVLYEVNRGFRLSRVFGGVVLPEYRGADLLQEMMEYGAKYLTMEKANIDVIYATTRTNSPAPQKITDRLGYKKLGIFPNVHKTDIYETHCLTAYFTMHAFEKRFSDHSIHPELKGFFNIVKDETQIPVMKIAEEGEYIPDDDKSLKEPVPALELIDASEFAFFRFKRLKEKGELPAHFYPFHEPNIVITSPCQRVELFLYLSKYDTYCTIIGVKKPPSVDFTEVLNRVIDILKNRNVRYIEILARADKLKTTHRILKAGFVPCAYFPAFQLLNGKRYDTVILSKTFEVLDFSKLKLEGLNRKFLSEYFKRWKKIHLSKELMPEESFE